MRTPQLLEIIELGNPLLRSVANWVTNIKDPSTQELIDDMLFTCEKADGMGMAAPQIGRSLRIFIVASKPNSRYPHAPFMEPTVIINPEIRLGMEVEADYEGCLSIPGLRGIVIRAKSLRMSYHDRSGTCQLDRAYDGFIARVIQHEFDHLQGIVFTDRANVNSFITNKEYQRMMAEECEKIK